MVDEKAIFQRAPHDRENPYVMINVALLRNNDLSPNCRWLIMYLLANKDGWNVKISQIVKHLKGQIGRDQVYAIVNEAIEAGYILREKYIEKGLERTRYLVSETPSFKKYLPLPEFQDTGNQDTEIPDAGNQDALSNIISKKDHLKKDQGKNPPIPPKGESAIADEVEISLPSYSFSEEVEQIHDSMTSTLKEAKPDFKTSPLSEKQMKVSIDHMLRLDNRTKQKIVDVFQWAIHDEFWRDKMFKPNPAKYLREKFDQLEMKMNKPEKKTPFDKHRNLGHGMSEEECKLVFDEEIKKMGM